MPKPSGQIHALKQYGEMDHIDRHYLRKEDLPRKIWYPGNLAHDNKQEVAFYVNGTIEHSLEIRQSDINDFICESADNKKLKIMNNGMYSITVYNGYKSSSDDDIIILASDDPFIQNTEIKHPIKNVHF